MVSSFYISQIPPIRFGIGSFNELPDRITTFGNKALILTGKMSFLHLKDKFQEKLSKLKIKYFFEIIDQEPTPAIVDNIVAKHAGDDISIVVAIGGGSVIDAGKAVSAMLPLNEPVIHYLEGVGHKIPSGQKVQYIAVPTTSGTGSECTKNAVISEVGINGFKKSLRHDNYIPNLALVDPVLSMGCSPQLTATTGMDALSQLIESYVSVKATEITDTFAMDGITKIFENLLVAYSDGGNIEARSSMSYAATLSGITLANAGLGTVHGFASSVGGRYNIPHGIVCGTLIGICNAHNIERLKNDKEKPAFSKYVKLGKIAAKNHSNTDMYYLDYLIGFLNELVDKLSIPELSHYGVTVSEIESIAKKTDNKNNPVKLYWEELAEILTQRI